MGLLLLLNQLVGFLLMSVFTVSVGQKILSYLNTRAKYWGYVIGMIILSSLIGGLIMLLARQANATTLKRGVILAPYTQVIEQAAIVEGIPAEILQAICTIESGLNPSKIHEDDGNGPSVGLCQIKPTTARLMGFTGKFKDLLDPKTNATYAAKYFKWQLDRYDGNQKYAIAAYNSGSLNLNDKNQIRNIRYVRKVLVLVAQNEK